MKKLAIFQAFALLTLFLNYTTAMAEYSGVRDVLVEEYCFEDNEKLTEFIDYYGLTINNLKEFEILYLYDHFDDTRKNTIADFLSYENRDSLFQWNKINKVGIIYNAGSNITVIILDKSSNSLYLGDGSLLHGSPEITRKKFEFSFDDYINKLINENQVSSWELYYPSTIDDSTGWLFWKLAFQDEQDNIWQSSGAGSLADNLPESFEQVIRTIVTLYTE